MLLDIVVCAFTFLILRADIAHLETWCYSCLYIVQFFCLLLRICHDHLCLYTQAFALECIASNILSIPLYVASFCALQVCFRLWRHTLALQTFM